MVRNQMGGSLVPSAEGLTEMRAAASARAPAKPGASAQSTQRRQRLKELLVTQLSKQFGATADPNLRAIIRAEAERALAKGRVSPEDIRELERNIRKTINLATSGTFDGSKPPVDAGHASERIDWGVLYEYKKVHGDEAERARLQRERDARVLLNSQIRHQIAERDAARRAALADEAAYAASEAAALARGRAEDSAKVARHKALVESERALNAEHVRLVEKKRQDEAHLSRLEDERMLAEMRSADAIAREERKRRAVEKAKRLEFARLADERSVRLKLEQREREDAEQRRLDAVWKGMLDEQERKREEGLKRIFEQQTVRQEAYGKSAGAEMAERAMRDEMNMLRWQTTYAQQQEERCARRATGSSMPPPPPPPPPSSMLSGAA